MSQQTAPSITVNSNLHSTAYCMSSVNDDKPNDMLDSGSHSIHITEFNRLTNLKNVDHFYIQVADGAIFWPTRYYRCYSKR